MQKQASKSRKDWVIRGTLKRRERPLIEMTRTGPHFQL